MGEYFNFTVVFFAALQALQPGLPATFEAQTRLNVPGGGVGGTTCIIELCVFAVTGDRC